MKQFPYIVLILLFASCAATNKINEITFPQAGWTVRIPPNSNLLTQAQVDSFQEETIKKIADTSYAGIDMGKPLFLIQKGQYNLFGSTFTPYNQDQFATWEESYAASKQLIIDLIVSKQPAITIVDSASTTEIIDNVKFEKFYIKTFYEKQQLTLQNYWYYRKHLNHDFGINICYDDQKIGDEFFKLLRNSKFVNK